MSQGLVVLREVRTPIFAVLLFCIAGSLFVLLSVYDGYSALASHGIDIRLTDEASRRILQVAAITWLVGLASALLGLLAWLSRRMSRTQKIVIAIADLAIMVALIGTASAVIGAASTMWAPVTF